jgi:L-lactate utilization protein LutC
VDRPARRPGPLAAALTQALIAALEGRRASGEAIPPAGAGAAAAARAGQWGVARAVVADDPWLDELGVPEALTCGVTVPAWAVAERGTLALEAGAAHGRSIDVACSHHLAVLPAGRIVGTLAEGLALSFRGGRRPASAVSLVTGPSRTSDIEKISTLGAHGALAEHVLIVEDAETR